MAEETPEAAEAEGGRDAAQKQEDAAARRQGDGTKSSRRTPQEKKAQITLRVHYMSTNRSLWRQFTVVLDYSLTCGQALTQIRSRLPVAAVHYAPINDFSYIDDGARIIVHNSQTYADLEAFSKTHNDEVDVKLTSLDAGTVWGGGSSLHSGIEFGRSRTGEVVRTFLKVHTRPRLAYALRCRGY